MNPLLTHINELAQQFPWETLLASGVLSPFLSGVTHWLQIEGSRTYKLGPVKITGEQVILVLLLVLSAGGTYLGQFISGHSTNPHIVALQAMTLAFMTQPVYFFVVKPAIKAYNSYIEKQIQQRLNALTLTPAPIETSAPAPVAPGTSVSPQAVAATVTTQQFND